ncbi:hypothetical protein K438DRAFT_1776129 [Mycena galopus ATCC 62051]|nr:hypothetical protein K438DRAFT_1776129 [Mycena galopus ATCC 62051]
MLKLVQDKLARIAPHLLLGTCHRPRHLQALAITFQGLQVTSLKIKMVAAKLTAYQHRVTNLCSHCSAQNLPAEVQRIKEADTAKEAECHARCEHYSRMSNKDHYFNVSIGDGSYNIIYLAAILDGHKEEIESIEKAAVELGFGTRVDCITF